MKHAEHICKCYHIFGKVQGVYFRASTREQAVRLGISGYARNLGDGSVEVMACSRDVRQIELLANWLHDGPKWARVERVQTIHCTENIQNLLNFTVR